MYTETELTGHYLRTVMNSSEARTLLDGIRLVDNRRVNDGTVEMWRRILSDLELAECQFAVIEHFKTSSSYLEPQHIRHIVKKWREEKAALAQKEEYKYDGEASPPPNNFDQMVAFYKELATMTKWGAHEDPDEVARGLGLEPPTPLWEEE